MCSLRQAVNSLGQIIVFHFPPSVSLLRIGQIIVLHFLLLLLSLSAQKTTSGQITVLDFFLFSRSALKST